jgi:uncharacterized protein (UPF0276 family)
MGVGAAAVRASVASIGIGWRHPHYGGLLEQRPALDFVEVHSENFFGEGGAALAVLEQGRAHYPISLHGVGLGLGSAAGIDAWHLDQLARLVERIEPVRVSDHACFARAPLGDNVAHAADLLPVPFHAQALAVMRRNVEQVQERLRRTILVENLSAYLTPAGSDRHEAEFLVELAQATGCRLLVDVNNLYVNALNARRSQPGLDPLQACRDWLDRIPAALVGEIHLAGHCAMEDIAIDDHGSRVCEDVWQAYAHALACFGPVPTLVEWDTDIPPLDVLLQEAARARQAFAQPTGVAA